MARARGQLDPRPVAIAAAVFIAAIVPFLPAATAGFVNFDDPELLFAVDGYHGLAPANLRWMFTTTHMGHYQPLTWVSYALDYLLWRMQPGSLDPMGFHITNLFLHATNAVLVFFLARRLIAAARPLDAGPFLDAGAAAAALLFAIHPLRVESVAWVTERRDVLSTALLLAALLAYLRAFPARSTVPASRAAYAASIALLLLSLLAKAWGMTFFVVLVVLDLYPLRRLPPSPLARARPSARQVLLQKAPYALLALGAAAMAAHAQASVPYTRLPLEYWGWGARAVQALYGLMFYIQKFLWPVDLAALYEVPIFQSLAQPRFVAAFIAVAALAAAAIALRRRWPAFTAAAAAYAVVLSPVLGLLQSGPQLVADRYSYLANIAWAVLIGGLIARWLPRAAPTNRLAAAATGLAVAAGLGVLTWRQTLLWRDTGRLFAHAAAVAPGPITHLNYGRELAARDQHEAAAAQFQAATSLNPRYGEAWFALANALNKLDRLPEAEQAYLKARALMADSWRPNLMLGILYISRLDRTRDAADCFRAAVANVEAPGARSFSARPYLMLAAALDELGDQKGAREMLERAARDPETRDEALEHLRELDTPPR